MPRNKNVKKMKSRGMYSNRNVSSISPVYSDAMRWDVDASTADTWM